MLVIFRSVAPLSGSRRLAIHVDNLKLHIYHGCFVNHETSFTFDRKADTRLRLRNIYYEHMTEQYSRQPDRRWNTFVSCDGRHSCTYETRNKIKCVYWSARRIEVVYVGDHSEIPNPNKLRPCRGHGFLFLCLFVVSGSA